jgi:hypothetical protein
MGNIIKLVIIVSIISGCTFTNFDCKPTAEPNINLDTRRLSLDSVSINCNSRYNYKYYESSKFNSIGDQ